MTQRDDLKFTDCSDYYINRELSWLEFNKRVLKEAKTRDVKLFERLKFLAITASNLDEFFMVRVASLKDMVAAGYNKEDISGLTPKKQLEEISLRSHEFTDMQYRIYNTSLRPELSKAGLRIITKHEKLSESEAFYLDNYFKDSIYPVLTPMAVDASRPFPLISNKSLNIAALIKRKEGSWYKAKPVKQKNKKKDNYKGYVGEGLDFAVVKVPSVLPRVIEIPEKYSSKAERSLIFLEELIEKHIDMLFLNYDVIAMHPFRIMRNAELDLDEEDAADLLEEIKKGLKNRRRGEAIRLDVEKGIDKRLLRILKKELELTGSDIFYVKGALDLRVLADIYKLEGLEEFKNPVYKPAPVKKLSNEDDIFTNIKRSDILLSHPYQSFDHVTEFVRAAAYDKDVLAIKQTLYRVSGNSPIIEALEKAAEQGKQVTVLVELKARFDEENNINWAKKLEKAGCHVIYGLLGLKVHSKITLVLRKEETGIREYVHLATGNYNDSTAKLYTDFGMFTCRQEIGQDAIAFFNMLSGYSKPQGFNKLIVAPIWMKDTFIKKIEDLTCESLKGKKTRIVAKMNSLSDKDIIPALYRASMAGVSIDLIVRGICCLKPGIKGVSDNIKVRSIIGNFLEHARVFCFAVEEEEEIYLGSADWMYRNLEKRVEIVFPVEDENIKSEIRHYLDLQLSDNMKSHILDCEGEYKKVKNRGKDKISAQDILSKEAWESV
jgi:polyphosphate kinase 1